jgi:RNA recognition motif-containing protein
LYQGTSDNLKGGGKGNGIPEGWTAEIQFGDYSSGKIEQFLGRDLQPTDTITTADGEEITGSALKELTGDDSTSKFPIKIKEWRTTLTIRHVPNNHTKYDLIKALDSQGFEGRYNFVHLPWDKDKDSSKGYAFVNFDSVEQALLAFEKISQVQWSQISRTRSKKACEVCWGSSKDQGYEANLKKWAISVWDDKFKPTFGLDCIDAIRHVCV